MTQRLRCPPGKTRIEHAKVLLGICVVVYSATLWVLALWTSTHADEGVASITAAGASVIASVGPGLLTSLTIAGVFGLLVGLQFLMYRLAPLSAASQARQVIDNAPPLTPLNADPVKAAVTATQPAALSFPAEPAEPASPLDVDATVFQVAHARSGKLIWTYAREGLALGFVRDVVRVRSHADAAQFELRVVHRGATSYTVAQGQQLVRRALEDRVL
jgi:hypothetical protein